MAYTLPFEVEQLPSHGSTPQSQHTSLKAAVHATRRRRNGTLVLRYVELLRRRPAADFQAAKELGCDRSSINSVRNMKGLKDWIYAQGEVIRPESGEANAVWHVRDGCPL